MLVSFRRCERLEDQLNDLTELHQNETTNLKQELASIEEKVAYQAYERARDMQVHTPHANTQRSVSKLNMAKSIGTLLNENYLSCNRNEETVSVMCSRKKQQFALSSHYVGNI